MIRTYSDTLQRYTVNQIGEAVAAWQAKTGESGLPAAAVLKALCAELHDAAPGMTPPAPAGTKQLAAPKVLSLLEALAINQAVRDTWFKAWRKQGQLKRQLAKYQHQTERYIAELTADPEPEEQRCAWLGNQIQCLNKVVDLLAGELS